MHGPLVASSAPGGALARRLSAEAVVAVPGAALVVWALIADGAWMDRHILPDFYTSRATQALVLLVFRVLSGGLGLGLILWVRPRAGRLFARTPLVRLARDAAPFVVAVVLSLVFCEVLLSHLPWLRAQDTPAPREPLRRRDAQLGWVLEPSRQGVGRLGGRSIVYDIDASGHRVRRLGDAVDPARPTILFTGESIMLGHGLTWEESIPARVEALTGVQSASLAVEGYATDQAYLRLRQEWPRYRRPVAVVSLFMPSLFRRNLDVDRPRLDPGLAWRPPDSAPRLVQLARRAVLYRTDADIDRGVAMSRAALGDTVEMARRRGATPLIVVPQLAPETVAERTLRRRVLDEAGLPYVMVNLDPGWRLPSNRHPDARAARVIARAIAAYLQAHPGAEYRRCSAVAGGEAGVSSPEGRSPGTSSCGT